MPFYLRQIVPVDVGRNFAERDEENKHKLVESQEEAVNRSVVDHQSFIRARVPDLPSLSFPELLQTSYASSPVWEHMQVIFLVGIRSYWLQ